MPLPLGAFGGSLLVSQKEAEEANRPLQEFRQELKKYSLMPTQAKKQFLVRDVGRSDIAEADEATVEKIFKEYYDKNVGFMAELTQNHIAKPFSIFGLTGSAPPKDAAIQTAMGIGGAAATALLPGPFKGAGLSMLASAPFTSTESFPADLASAAVNAVPVGRGGLIKQTLKNMLLGGAEGVARKAAGDEDANPALQGVLGGTAGLLHSALPWLTRMLPGPGKEISEDMLFQARKKFRPEGRDPIPNEEVVQMLKDRPELLAKIDQTLGQPGLAAATAAPRSIVTDDVLQYIRGLDETAKGSVPVAPLTKRPTIKPLKETPTFERGFSPIKPGTPDEVVEGFIGGGRTTIAPGTASTSRAALGVGFDADKMYTNLRKQVVENKKYSAEALTAFQAFDFMNDAKFGTAKGVDAVMEVANKHKLFSNTKNFPSRASIDAAAEELAKASNFDKTSAVAVLEHAVKYGRGEGTLQKLVDKVGKEADPGIRALIDETKVPGETVETVIPGQAPKFDLADNTAYEQRVAPMRQQAVRRTEEANAKIAAENAFRQEQAQVANARNVALFKQKLGKFDALRKTRELRGLPGTLPDADELTQPLLGGTKVQEITTSLDELFKTIEEVAPKDLPRTRQLMIQELLSKVRDKKLTPEIVERLAAPKGKDAKTAGRAWEYLKTLTGETQVPDDQADAALGLSVLLRNEELLNTIAEKNKTTIWLSGRLAGIGARFRELLKADPSGAVKRYMQASPEETRAIGTRMNTIIPMLRSGARVGAGETARSLEGEGQRETLLDAMAEKFKGVKNRQKIVDRLP